MANSQLTSLFTDIASAIREKNGQTGKIAAEAFPEAIRMIESGMSLPTLTKPGSAGTMLSGYQMINGSGNVITGTIPNKTSSNLTASGSVVTVPSGYYSVQATKAVASATQATPAITVSSNGLITATATQTAGYVVAGSKSATKQLTTQAAKTVTPTKSAQTAVASGTYTTGNITVAAIPSKYQDVSGVTAGASDILSGKKIVNSSGTVVTGTMPNNGAISSTMDGISVKSITVPSGYTTGGTVSLDSTIDNEVDEQADLIAQIKSVVAELPDIESGELESGESSTWSDEANAILNKTVSSYTNDRVKTIRAHAFYDCKTLDTVNFPKATTILECAFMNCSSLTTVSFPSANIIHGFAFANCSSLSGVYLLGSSVCTLTTSNTFAGTPYIYVPASLLTSYQTATNWTYFSSYFSAI